MTNAISITETPNELTTEIDLASPVEIVRLLRQCDAQIYNGWKSEPGLNDQEILERLTRLVEVVTHALKSRGRQRVVISGAGTSGRLAMFTARAFNRLLATRNEPQIFRYLMAGGKAALIKAQEGAEDNPHQGVSDLKTILSDIREGIYIGVTCGFSAPYIAGQLDWALTQPKMMSVLLGFNPVSLARQRPIENWDKTFLEVARAVESSPRGLVLNPLIGPEPITGSTRMKGGSATKWILEAAFAVAFARAFPMTRRSKGCLLGPLRGEKNTDTLRRLLWQYEIAREQTYQQRDAIAQLIVWGGDALLSRRSICYLGRDSFGLLGLIDASECPPTFGATFEDVRGFIEGGWPALLEDDEDLSSHGPQYRIRLTDFGKNTLPSVKSPDLIVGILEDGRGPEVLRLLKDSAAQGARTALLTYERPSGFAAKKSNTLVVTPHLEIHSLIPGVPSYAEFSTKLILNALTTGAHILAGKVYSNRMIDLRLSNSKLYYRILGILRILMGVDEPTADKCVRKSLFDTDSLTEAQSSARISALVERGASAEKLVPKALLLATGQFSHAQACEALRREPIVRKILETHLPKS
ncbi:MAG: hypothetical protein V2A74_11355 [bacterium]